MFEEDADHVGPIKPFAWPLLMQAAKPAVKEGTRLKLTKAGEKAFMLPAHEHYVSFGRSGLASAGSMSFDASTRSKDKMEKDA